MKGKWGKNGKKEKERQTEEEAAKKGISKQISDHEAKMEKNVKWQQMIMNYNYWTKQ